MSPRQRYAQRGRLLVEQRDVPVQGICSISMSCKDMPRRYIRLVSRHGKHIIEHDFIRPEAPAAAGLPVDSIDYAVMAQYRQGSSYAACRVLERYGFMEALYEKNDKNTEGNVCTGDVIAQDVRNCYLYGTGRLIAALGVENLIIVETLDAVLVGKRAQIQDVKKIVAE